MMKRKELSKREIRGMESKQRIYDTAMDLFKKYGYDNVTVDDICEASGFSKGGFYNHFSSKDAILQRSFLAVDSEYEEFYNDLPPNLSASFKLAQLLQFQIKNVQSDIYKDALRIGYIAEISQKTASAHSIFNPNRPFCQVIRKIILEGVETGEFISFVSVEDLTTLVMSCMRGLLFNWIANDESGDVTIAYDAMFSVILKGITK